MKKPTTNDIYELYQEVKNLRGLQRQQVSALFGRSAGVSPGTADNWIGGYKNCPPACWRCLNLDFRGIDINHKGE